ALIAECPVRRHIVSVRRHPHQPPNAMGPADHAQQDAVLSHGPYPAAASAALARSCAFFFGADLTGCSLQLGIGPTPFCPRNFATRSVATAPCDTQCWMRSACSLTLSSCSAGSIGL